jgi:prepilin-type N-terminal cleavage/methylation domain-containing protein
MRTRRQGTKGFTLIELMVSVAIIGILSSIAIPSFQKFQLRSKQAERAVLMTSIYRAIEDYWMRDAKFPTDWGGGASFLNLTNWNPNSNPGTFKRPWRITGVAGWDDWGKISLQVDGGVYYSYYAYGYVLGGGDRYTLVYTMGDLDGDNVRDEWEKEWYFRGTQLQKWAGNTCSDCTWEWRWPAVGQAF